MDLLTLAKWGVTISKGGLTVYKHREQMTTLWSRMAKWRDPQRAIAVTGMAGVGKTVLVDFLRLEGFRPGYRPPETSIAPERHGLVGTNQRLVLTVVPGQETPVRHTTLDTLESGGVDGVVHVVANGFARVTPTAQRQLVSLGTRTVDDYRAHLHTLEEDDLDAVCEAIRRSCRRHRRPRWVIVACTQADLYGDPRGLAQASERYHPDGRGPFAERLRTLVGQVGSDNLSWTALPVFAWPEDFTWGDTTVLSDKDIELREQLLARLLEEIDRRSSAGAT